jgi:hypothetical protein
MSLRILPAAALVMALLVASLPVTFAQTLNVVRFSGQDKVNGYGLADDTLTAVVEALIPTEDIILPSQVRLKAGEYAKSFDSCRLIGNDSKLHECTYQESYESAYGVEPYTIELLNDDGRVVKSASLDYAIDTLDPDVAEFTVEPTVSNDGRFIARVVAEDYGSQSGVLEQCSGVKNITLKAGGAVQASAGGGPGQCRVERTVEFTRAAEGATALCASVNDFLGHQSSPSCIDIIVDRSPPVLSNLDLRGQPGDFRLSFLRTGETRLADVSVEIDDASGVIPDTVKAAFDSISPGTGERGPDDSTGDTYVWRDIPITHPERCAVTVTATDLLGNTATKELTCSIGVDNDAPALKKITASAERADGVPIFGRDGSIIAIFDEAGIGMSTGDVQLSLASLGIGARKPSRCEREGADWACTWGGLVPSVGAGTYTVTLTSAKDDLGNALSTATEQQVEYDPTAPTILGFAGFKVFHNTAEFGNLTVNGDGIEVTYTVSGVDTASADFFEIGGINETPGTCIDAGENSSVKNCTFAALIQASGPADATTAYTFRDLAGNTARANLSFFIHEVVDEAGPDYWASSVTCSPSLIDRRVTALLEHKVYCRVSLTKKSPAMNVSVANVAAAELTECNANISGYVSDVKALNTRAGTTSPFLVLTLAATDFTINELPVSCPLKIYNKVGQRLSRAPETEYVNTTLRFYELPLGELNANVDRDIERAKEKAEKALKWVGTLTKYMGYAEGLCTLKSVLSNGLATLEAIQNVLGFIAWKLDLGLGGSGKSLSQAKDLLCKKAQDPIDKFSTDISNILKEFCNIVNCAVSDRKEGAEGGGYDAVDIFAGKNPVCTFLKDAIMSPDVKALGVNLGTLNENAINVKDSLILSAACLCIPGIIYGLNKYRQIVCYGGLCKARLKDTGIPLSYCDDIEGYMTCQWVIGEIFNIIPFAALYNLLISELKEIYANPLRAFALLGTILCSGFCGPTDPYNWGHVGCAVLKIVEKVGDGIADVKRIKSKGYWATGEDFCEELEDIE